MIAAPCGSIIENLAMPTHAVEPSFIRAVNRNWLNAFNALQKWM
jgi:hypothetical protein